MDKSAKAVSFEEFRQYCDAAGIPPDKAQEKYDEYLGMKKTRLLEDIMAPNLVGASMGLAMGGPMGAVFGSVAGPAIMHGVKKLDSVRYDNWLREKILDAMAKRKNNEEKEAEMNPYQHAFVHRCRQRGVDPEKVIEFSKKASAAEMQRKAALRKQAEDVKRILGSMTPYQRGFAIRCTQRGMKSAEVAEFLQKRAYTYRPITKGPKKYKDMTPEEQIGFNWQTAVAKWRAGGERGPAPTREEFERRWEEQAAVKAHENRMRAADGLNAFYDQDTRRRYSEALAGARTAGGVSAVGKQMAADLSKRRNDAASAEQAGAYSGLLADAGSRVAANPVVKAKKTKKTRAAAKPAVAPVASTQPAYGGWAPQFRGGMPTPAPGPAASVASSSPKAVRPSKI